MKHVISAEYETLNSQTFTIFTLQQYWNHESSSSTCESIRTSKNVLFQSLEVTVMTTLPVAGRRSISQRIVQHRALPLSQSCTQYTSDYKLYRFIGAN